MDELLGGDRTPVKLRSMCTHTRPLDAFVNRLAWVIGGGWELKPLTGAVGANDDEVGKGTTAIDGYSLN